jgi:hypothetical protein
MADIVSIGVDDKSTLRHPDRLKKVVQFSSIQTTHYDFNTTNVALTPSINRLAPIYKVPEERSASCVAPQGSISRPNYEGKEINQSINQSIIQSIITSLSSSLLNYSSIT